MCLIKMYSSANVDKQYCKPSIKLASFTENVIV